MNIRIGFIGAGKVGFSLGKYFTENKILVTGYYSKNEDSAKKASNFTNTKKYTNLKSLINDSDTIFITTPDDCINEVWNEIKELSIKNKIICHCSGSISSDIFSNIYQYGAFAYSIHPIFAISSKYDSYKFLNQAFFTIEGSSQKLSQIKNLINRLGNNFKVISKENKALYHCSTVMASNFIIGLISASVDGFKSCGFNESEAIEALFPLIQNNILNIKEKGILESLTGPVERADLKTIQRHYEVMNNKNTELYKNISLKLLDLAKLKNNYRNYSKIERFLGE